MKNNTAAEILRYALSHLEKQRDDFQQKIDYIHTQLGTDPGTGGHVVSIKQPVSVATRPKRVLSVAARKRIANAQKKRWAEFHKKQKAA